MIKYGNCNTFDTASLKLFNESHSSIIIFNPVSRSLVHPHNLINDFFFYTFEPQSRQSFQSMVEKIKIKEVSSLQGRL